MRKICYDVDIFIQQHKFLNEFRMNRIPSLGEKLEKFLKLLVIFFLYVIFFHFFISPLSVHFRDEFVDLISVLSTQFGWLDGWQLSEYDAVDMYKSQIIIVLQDIMEIILQDIMVNGFK